MLLYQIISYYIMSSCQQIKFIKTKGNQPQRFTEGFSVNKI